MIKGKDLLKPGTYIYKVDGSAKWSFIDIENEDSLKACLMHGGMNEFIFYPIDLDPMYFLNGILERQHVFSLKTFGPDYTPEQAIDHISDELKEVTRDKTDIFEWIDIALIALDGAMRCGYSPNEVRKTLIKKISINEKRSWPDWRTSDRSKKICHINDNK